MSASCNTRSFTRNLTVVVLALLPAAGCFRSADVSKIVCTSDGTCPSDYFCVFGTANPTQGKCEKRGTVLDGGHIDLAGSHDGLFVDGGFADGQAADEISPDGSSAIDVNRGMDGVAPLDTVSDPTNSGPDRASTSPPDGATDTFAIVDGATGVHLDVRVALEAYPDASLPDIPTDTAKLPDAPAPDAPVPLPDVGTGCIAATDCPGPCQTCSASSHACIAVSGQDDPSGHCAGTCDASSVCKAKQGQACQASGTCASSLFCAPDGHCCDRACAGPCESCETGVCTAVTGDPHKGHTTCVATSSECSGNCTGASDGQCTWSATACGQASCTTLTNAQSQPTGTNYVPLSTCNAGACPPATAKSCTGGLVCASATACKSTCTSDSDCLTGNTCSGGTCVGKKSTGAPCSVGSDCLLGNCADGFCCESTCTGTCMACSSAKTGAAANGLCRPVSAGTDPDIECPLDASQCGRDGTCDGAGACRYQSASTSCGTESCTGQGSGTHTPLGHCNGSGTCIPGTAGSCSNNMPCATSTTCATTCVDRSTTGCPSGYKCTLNGTACVLASVPCGDISCNVANGEGCCVSNSGSTYACQTSPSQCYGYTNDGVPIKMITCQGKEDCPNGQICGYVGVGCADFQVWCTNTVPVDGPYSSGHQICNPNLSPSECLSGTCQPDCNGLYYCH